MLREIATPGSISEYVKASVRRTMGAGALSVDIVRPALRSARIVVLCVARDEAFRLAHFLRYYRALGAEHFIFVDNQSSDGSLEFLRRQEDVSIIVASGSYKRARYGNDWANEVIRRYCRDKWLLYVDPDEFLVYPHVDRFGLTELADHLEDSGLRSLWTMMIDMYSRRPIADNACASGQDPLEVCNLFDGSGYVSSYEAATQTLWCKGGVRGRVYFADNVWDGPALNKTPFVHVTGETLFLKSTHQLWPPSLNRSSPKAMAPPAVTGVLLHFKFLSSFVTKVMEEGKRNQHTSEYAAYATGSHDLHGGQSFCCEQTRHYRGWQDLAREGLLDGEDWNRSRFV